MFLRVNLVMFLECEKVKDLVLLIKMENFMLILNLRNEKFYR